MLTNVLQNDLSSIGNNIAYQMVFRIDLNGEKNLKDKECETSIESLNISELI